MGRRRPTDVRAQRFLRVFVLLTLSACLQRDTYEPPPRNQALYVAMRDGVRIAVDVWLPEQLSPDDEIPAVIHATRYWRARDAEEELTGGRAWEVAAWNGAGYAVVLVDVRGSGASFGVRRFELAEDEVQDLGEIATWITTQDWSNGRVGAYGVSYAGNTAEMLAVNQNPAVRAVAPLFNDFDNFGHLVFPGGLLDVGFLEGWSDSVAKMDANDVCGLAGLEGEACENRLESFRGVKPVDEDTDRAFLARAVAEHAANTVPFESALAYDFRDDPFGPFGERNVGYRRSPAGHLPQIEASGVAMFVWVSWVDAATVNGALGRYNTIANPQQVFIGAWDHGGQHHADPFLPADSPLPDEEVRYEDMIAFFDEHLKESGSGTTPKEIHYYTMGAGTWSRTEIWPPAGFETESFYFGPGGELAPEPPSEAGADTYTVDFTATTGRHNRWATNGGAGDVIYPDRAGEDEKLLTYTSAPMESDVEITGHPIVTLHVASTEPDGAFLAYLEDVAPDGRVTYITEGQLRALVRRVSDEDGPYWKAGPHRTELRSDAMPLVPGEVAEVTFELWATSTLIRRGHRIRVAIAGADEGTFLRYPKDGSVPTLTLHRSETHPSRIDLPMKRPAR